MGRTALLFVFALPLVTACRSGGVELEQPVGSTHRVTSATGGAKPTGTDDPSAPIVVYLDEPLAKKCGLAPGPSEFKVFESKLVPVGVDPFVELGKCFAREPGASLLIVGHTDPRTDADYAEKLGLLRADRARAAVVAQGIPSARIGITSRGARDAEGTDEATWKSDRRVELFLAEPRSQAGLDVPQYGPGPGGGGEPTTPAAASTNPAAARTGLGRRLRGAAAPTTTPTR